MCVFSSRMIWKQLPIIPAIFIKPLCPSLLKEGVLGMSLIPMMTAVQTLSFRGMSGGPQWPTGGPELLCHQESPVPEVSFAPWEEHLPSWRVYLFCKRKEGGMSLSTSGGSCLKLGEHGSPREG